MSNRMFLQIAALIAFAFVLYYLCLVVRDNQLNSYYEQRQAEISAHPAP